MRAHEFIDEKINPETIKDGFIDSKVVGDGKYLLTAKGGSFTYYDRQVPTLDITLYDNETKERAGYIYFTVRFREQDNEPYLVSMSTKVFEKYRGKGLARLMYQYGNSLGNDIMPSNLQTNMGRGMWTHLKKDIKQLDPLPTPPKPEKLKWYDRWKKYLLRPAT